MGVQARGRGLRLDKMGLGNLQAISMFMTLFVHLRIERGPVHVISLWGIPQARGSTVCRSSFMLVTVGMSTHISGQASYSGGADQQKSDSIVFTIALFCFVYVRKNMKWGGMTGRSCGRERHDQNILYEIPPICVLERVYACV